MPQRAAELAVGHGLQADVFLQFHHLADRRVFQRAQVLCGDFALAEPLALGEQGGRAQKAANMIGAEGRLGAMHAHVKNSCRVLWKTSSCGDVFLSPVVRRFRGHF